MPDGVIGGARRQHRVAEVDGRAQRAGGGEVCPECGIEDVHAAEPRTSPCIGFVLWIGSETWPRSRSNRRKSSQEETTTEEVVETDVAERKEVIDDDVDAILDEIDDVLETNAEDFVKSFIQKGGQ